MIAKADDASLLEKSQLLQQLRMNTELRPAAPRTSRRLRWFLCAGVFVMTGAGVVALLAIGGEQFEVETATAVTPSAQSGAATTLQASGYVTARRQATVSAQITGTLTQVLIEEGRYVKAGQVLARLENATQIAALAQAQAQFNIATALLVQYDMEMAQALRDLKRSEDLAVHQLVSQQAVETARTQTETLGAKVESQRKEVELTSAVVKGAQVQLEYTTVRAPFSGVIIAKAAQAGEIVSPVSAGGGFTRTGIGTIVDMNSLEMEVDVNESYINRIRENQSVNAKLEAYPGLGIPGHVIAIVPTANRSKATVKVRIAIDQKDARILPDMGVRVSFLDSRPQNGAPTKDSNKSASLVSGVLVPASAIVQRDGRSIVFTIQEGRARARPVILGQAHGDLVLVVEGVANGATVIRTPSPTLHDDARIVVRKQ